MGNTKEQMHRSALDQFTGFGHGTKGFSVISLAESMGLEAHEFLKLKDELQILLKWDDFEELEEYFAKAGK